MVLLYFRFRALVQRNVFHFQYFLFVGFHHVNDEEHKKEKEDEQGNHREDADARYGFQVVDEFHDRYLVGAAGAAGLMSFPRRCR